ncbi:PREDICTED: ubiquilin-3-like [Nicrophorus vespilloides]|uniref:Ubiquilin-3-like n=1 Tax=Nicrophorus vespilloides TaxID=110193 RepID=A0ABM1N1N4_NICVS|nr:PREDICTED: ubiquilin-3-like [Nicrophorus vespilloides]
MSSTEQQDSIRIMVKTHSRNEEFNVPLMSTVAEIKPEIAERFEAQEDQLCLIYAGRPLKDNNTLKDQNVRDGFAIHLVIRRPTQPPPISPQPTTPPPSRNTFEDLTSNLLNNPEYLRTLIAMDPRLQTYLEQNPEIAHAINNPTIMREYLQLATNPNLMQEFLRNQDLTLRNIENMPGGFAALQSIYNNISDFETPEALGETQTATSQPTTNLNSNPLPNPWSSEQQQNASSGQPQAQPELMSQMLANPQIQQIMRELASDPNFLQAILSNNPTFTDPNMQEYLRVHLPSLLQFEMPAMGEEDSLGVLTPEARYSGQLEQLISMGFPNREANLSALVRSMGDLNGAIDILTRGPQF